MSEGESEQRLSEPGESAAEPRSSSPAEPPQTVPERRRRSFRASLWLAGLLALVVAAVALSPFWAPPVAPLLPWGEDRAETEALEARLAAVEARPVTSGHGIETVQSATTALAQRVAQLETAIEAQRAAMNKLPATANVDPQPIAAAIDLLSQRVQHLEAAAKPDAQSQAAVTAMRAGLQQVEQRLAGIETQSNSRAADEAAAANDTKQQLANLGKSDTDLAHRVAELERQAQSTSAAEIRTDGILALLLAQMREAVEQARPFPTEFNAFERLAQDPDLAASLRPLADAARGGMPSRAVLEKRLAELAGAIAGENQPRDDGGWGGQTLARLRGLITIRRVEGSPRIGPEALVNTAQTELARGNLAAAADKLDHLTGANADSARPWLQMARERLAVETGLDHLQELLMVRLGRSSAAPATPPATTPEEKNNARTRS